MIRSLLSTLTLPLAAVASTGSPGGAPAARPAELPVVEEALLDEIGVQRVLVEDLIHAFQGMAETAGIPPDDPLFQQVRRQSATVCLLYNGILGRIAFQVVEGHDVKYLQYVQDLEVARGAVEALEGMIPGEGFLDLIEKAARVASGLLATVAETLNGISTRADRLAGRVEAPPDALDLIHRLEMARSIRDAFAFHSFDDLVTRGSAALNSE